MASEVATGPRRGMFPPRELWVADPICLTPSPARRAQNERPDFNGDNAVGWAEYALEQERPGDAGVAAVRDLLRSLGWRPVVWGAHRQLP